MIKTFPLNSPVHAGHRVKCEATFAPHSDFWCLECQVVFRALALDLSKPRLDNIRWCVQVGEKWLASKNALVPDDEA